MDVLHLSNTSVRDPAYAFQASYMNKLFNIKALAAVSESSNNHGAKAQGLVLAL